MECNLCRQDANLQCQRCKGPYCSEWCQQKDWIRHRPLCYQIPKLVAAKFAKPSEVAMDNCDGAGEPELTPMMNMKTNEPLVVLPSSDEITKKLKQTRLKFQTLSVTSPHANTDKGPEKMNALEGIISNVKSKLDASIEFFKRDAITQVPLHVGDQVKVLCLDNSQVHDGMVTVRNFDITSISFKTRELTEQINKYCRECNRPYSPSADELCLTKYSRDQNWYRSVCIATDPERNEFRMEFIDYGNRMTTATNNIRKITWSFLYPSMANQCVIEGITPKTDSTKIIEARKYFHPDTVVDVAVTFVAGQYVLRMLPY